MNDRLKQSAAQLRREAAQQEQQFREAQGKLLLDAIGRMRERNAEGTAGVAELFAQAVNPGELEPRPDPAALLAQAGDAIDQAAAAGLQRPTTEDGSLRDELRRVSERARAAADQLTDNNNPKEK